MYFRFAAALIASLALAGCGLITIPGLSAGTSLKDVQARVGTPHDQRTLSDGTKAWDYVYGPWGFYTWRVNFDGSDRVSRVEQLLTHDRFMSVPANKLSRQDVLNTFGRPGQVSNFSNLGEEVWTYRYMYIQDYKLADLHFDAKSGVVKYATTYHDPAYYNAISQ